MAKNVGCDFPDNAQQELKCMQKVDYNDIVRTPYRNHETVAVPETSTDALKINFMGQYQDNSTLVSTDQPSISFSTIADERLVFKNYTARYQSGMVTKAPMIYGR